MIFKRISRSDPERVFIVCSNGYSTASLTNGQPVMWDTGDADGVSVTICDSTKKAASFAGVVSETIAAGEYGLVQVYGYHSAVIVTSNTAVDIFAGGPLFMNSSAFTLVGPWIATATTEEVGLCSLHMAAVALEAYGSVGTTGTIKAIVRAM